MLMRMYDQTTGVTISPCSKGNVPLFTALRSMNFPDLTNGLEYEKKF